MNLTHVLASVTSAAVPLAALALVLLLQTTVVLSIGLVIARFVRRRGAAVESVCQRIVLSAALLAPLVSAVTGLTVARVHLPVPAFAEAAPPSPADAEPQDRLEAWNTHPPAARPMVDPELLERFVTSRPHGHGVSSEPLGTTGILEKASASPAAPLVAARGSWFRFAAVSFCATWLCVAVLLAARLIGSLVSAKRLIAAAAEAELALVARCRELAEQIGVRCPGVKHSPFVPGPCVFGWRRPVILLSEGDAEIDDDVLIHELAHIARRDGFWKTLSEASTALLWFQPLLWRLKSRMQFCAEDVSDDFVVQFGTDRCAYADRLTRIAEQFAARSREFRIEQVGIGIVSYRSSLGRRVYRILDSRRFVQTRA